MTNYVGNLTPKIACEALRGVGLFFSPEEILIVAREERWAVVLPGERLAWFPASKSGCRRLTVDRRGLRLLADRCVFLAPRTLLLSQSGFEVRQMFPAAAIRGASASAASGIPNWPNGSASRPVPSLRSSIRLSAKRK